MPKTLPLSPIEFIVIIRDVRQKSFHSSADKLQDSRERREIRRN